MKHAKHLALSIATAMLALAGATHAQASEQPQFNAAGLLVAPNGMPLYTFDQDAAPARKASTAPATGSYTY